MKKDGGIEKLDVSHTLLERLGSSFFFATHVTLRSKRRAVSKPLDPPVTARGREILKAADKISERAMLEFLAAFKLEEAFAQGYLRECIRENVIRYLEAKR